MSKRKKPKRRSPVARYMNEFNKPATHRDRTKYRRKDKHKGRNFDPYSSLFFFDPVLQYNPNHADPAPTSTDIKEVCWVVGASKPINHIVAL